MGQLIELYNIFIKPEAYGTILILFIFYSQPKIKIFIKALNEYDTKSRLVEDIKKLLEMNNVSYKENNEAIYRTFKDYSLEVKLILHDIQSNLSKHDLTVKPDFANIQTKLNDLNDETTNISSKMLAQHNVVEALTKINGNIEKMDQLLVVLFNQVNNTNLNTMRQNVGIRASSDINEIKF